VVGAQATFPGPVGASRPPRPTRRQAPLPTHGTPVWKGFRHYGPPCAPWPQPALVNAPPGPSGSLWCGWDSCKWGQVPGAASCRGLVGFPLSGTGPIRGKLPRVAPAPQVRCRALRFRVPALGAGWRGVAVFPDRTSRRCRPPGHGSDVADVAIPGIGALVHQGAPCPASPRRRVGASVRRVAEGARKGAGERVERRMGRLRRPRLAVCPGCMGHPRVP
jgi:hypothetical protein